MGFLLPKDGAHRDGESSEVGRLPKDPTAPSAVALPGIIAGAGSVAMM
jgi:hypothetical protein